MAAGCGRHGPRSTCRPALRKHPPTRLPSHRSHIVSSRARLRGSYGMMEWTMIMESSPMHIVRGIESLSQERSIMPWCGIAHALILAGAPYSGWSGRWSTASTMSVCVLCESLTCAMSSSPSQRSTYGPSWQVHAR
eukprot:7298859-Prymnesium_polylepis.1